MALESLLLRPNDRDPLTDVFVTSYQFAGGDGSNRYAYDTYDFQRNRNIPDQSGQFAFNKEKNLFAYLRITSSSERIFTIISTLNYATITVPEINYQSVQAIAFSNDGGYMAVAGIPIGKANLEINIYETNNWTLYASPNIPMANNTSTLTRLTYSQNDEYLAIGQQGAPYLSVYRTNNWTPVSLTNIPSIVYDVVFSPDDNYLAACSYYSPGVTIYKVSDWTKLAGTASISGNPNSICWSLDQKYVYVSNRDTPYLRKYNFPALTLVKAATSAQQKFARKLVITHDGSLIGGAEKAIYDTDLNLVFEYPEAGSNNQFCAILRVPK